VIATATRLSGRKPHGSSSDLIARPGAYDLRQDVEEQRGRNHDDRGDGRQAEEKDPEDAG